MAAFKDKKNGSWYVQFRYTDWRGERQQKLKRGFATKKEAQTWEREFLMQKQADVNMSFESFVALYEKDVKPKLKLNTWLSKEHIIRTKILPYFKKRKLSEITARDVIDWQNEISGVQILTFDELYQRVIDLIAILSETPSPTQHTPELEDEGDEFPF